MLFDESIEINFELPKYLKENIQRNFMETIYSYSSMKIID